MMNILILNYEYPPLGGGAGVISHHIAKGFAQSGNKVVFVTAWYKNLPEREDPEGFEIIRLKSKRKHLYRSNPIEMLSWARKAKQFLSDYLKTVSFDICISNFTIPGGEVGLFVKNEFGIPYVIVSHGHDVPWFFPNQMFFYHAITFFWIKKIVSHSLGVFVQSEAMRKNAIRFIGKDAAPVFKVPNGCNIDKFVPDYSKKSDVFKLLFSCRLVSQKDPITFLKAIEIFDSYGIDYIATIAGDGPYLKKMIKFVKEKNLSGKVIFKGWLNSQKMIEEYQSASLFVAPSLQEGMSIAIMESISCGLYTMTTPVSENVELIKENINGEIFQSKDHELLAEKLKCFYQNKFLNGYKIPEDQINVFKDSYNWEGIIEKYKKIIINIVK